MPDEQDRDAAARRLAEIAIEAGAVLNRFRRPECRRATKADGSLVSEADTASEAHILHRLSEAFPGIPVVSEENAASHSGDPGPRFLLVDPLDGTRAFLSGGADFCVLVALVSRGTPVAGVLHAPATGQTWWAGATAFRAAGGLSGAVRLSLPPVRKTGRIAVISAEFAMESSTHLCAALGISEMRKENSALKFVRVAEGDADLYPRIGRTMQWDVAAGDALLRALGGGVYDLAGKPLVYGPGAAGWTNPNFVAVGGLSFGELLPGFQGTMSRLT